MQDPLHRLYRAKLTLLATVLLFGGFGLLLLGLWNQQTTGWQWLTTLLPINVGLAIFTTGLLGVAWQYVDGRDSDARDTERLKRVLADSATDMRDAVISGFAFEPKDIARVATPEVLDKIITNGLGIRLQDAAFAEEIYADLREQAIGIPERLTDARISIHLSPLPAGKGTPTRRDQLYDVVIRWEFTVIPHYATRRFTCLEDIDEFRELEHDTVANSAWYFKPKAGLVAADRDAFELVSFTVDGEPKAIRRSAKQGSQTYSASVGADAVAAGKPVDIAYTYRTVTARDGHLLRLRVDQPTRGLTIELDYGDSEIDHMNVVDFIASSDRAQISDSPSSLPGKVVLIEFDGWVLPRNGVAFIWS